MARIKITDDRQGRTFRTGINGMQYDIPVGSEQEVDDGLIDHLKGLGVAFDEIETSRRASSSKEGSEGELAPVGPHDVRAPAMDAKSLGDRPLAGDQPGDVTASGGVGFGLEGKLSIEDRAKISDTRVAAERSTKADVSAAELAGEGELGTDATKPAQGVQPTHKDDEPKQQKASKAKK